MPEKRWIVLVLLLILPTVSANDLFNSEWLILNLKIGADITTIPSGTDAYLDYVTADLAFYPRDSDDQEVMVFQAQPSPLPTDDGLLFRWDKPAKSRFGFDVEATLKTHNRYKPVKERIAFPIGSALPPEVKPYTKPSERIDSGDRDIIEQASQLAEGEDDLFEVVFELADWTKHNVNYSLSTLTASASQKASWVLANRYGVCDEITNLFIALARSLGIPAKFVSGVSYTNSEQFEENWGPHGWAEVYFPGVGWVPFDVTYGQVGYVDATHIKLGESTDSTSSSTKYEWRGYDYDISTSSLDIDTQVVETGPYLRAPVSAELRVFKDRVGFGSYNLVTVSLTNQRDHYLAVDLYLSKPREIEIGGENRQLVLVGPSGTREIAWVVRVPDGLDRNGIYTMPLAAYVDNEQAATAEFRADSYTRTYSERDMDQLVPDEKPPALSTGLSFECELDKDSYYVYEQPAVTCTVENQGNTFIKNLKVCLEECKVIDLGITETAEVGFKLHLDSAGIGIAVANATNAELERRYQLTYDVMELPSFGFAEISAPSSVSYGERFAVNFTLERLAQSPGRDMMVTFLLDGMPTDWDLSTLDMDREFIVWLEGKSLSLGPNAVKLQASWEDENGKPYSTETEFTIEMNDATAWQHVLIFFNDILRWVHTSIF